MAETLKEFLVGLGFKVDETSWSRFESTITKATVQANLLAEAITHMASAVVTKVAEVAEHLEQLHYQSQRTGSSVQSIKAFEYAVSQLGGTISGAASALEEFGRRIKLDAGFETWVRNLGVATRDAQGHLRDLGQVQAEVTQKVSGAHDQKLANVYREFISASDLRTWNAINNPDFWSLYNEEKKSADSAGLDDNAAAGAAGFDQSFRRTVQRLTDFAEGAEVKLMDALKAPLDTLDKFITAHQDEINSALKDIAGALSQVAVDSEKALEKLDWKSSSKDIIDTTHSIAEFVRTLSGFVAEMEDLNEKSKNWWIVKAFDSFMTKTPYASPDGKPEILGPDQDQGGGLWGTIKRGWKRWFGGGAQKTGAGGKYSAAEVAAILKRNGATDEEATILGAIAMPESSGNPDSHNYNPKTGDDSYGLFQINMLGDLGPERRAKYGLKSNEDLYDPDKNAQIAIAMHRASGGYGDWSTYRDGSYQAYLDAAKRGATGQAVTGMSPKGGPWVESGGKEYATDRNGVIDPNMSRPIAGSSWSPVGSAQAGTLSWDAPSAAWAAINSALPIGASSVSNYSRTIAPVSNTTITVNGVSNPHEAAAAVGSNVDRTNADIMRFLRQVAR